MSTPYKLPHLLHEAPHPPLTSAFQNPLSNPRLKKSYRANKVVMTICSQYIQLTAIISRSSAVVHTCIRLRSMVDFKHPFHHNQKTKTMVTVTGYAERTRKDG